MAPAVAALAQVEGAQVELIDGVGEEIEIDQMIFGQPIAQRRRRQERLLGLIGPVVCPHVSSFAFPSKTFHHFFVFSVGHTPRLDTLVSKVDRVDKLLILSITESRAAVDDILRVNEGSPPSG